MLMRRAHMRLPRPSFAALGVPGASFGRKRVVDIVRGTRIAAETGVRDACSSAEASETTRRHAERTREATGSDARAAKASSSHARAAEATCSDAGTAEASRRNAETAKASRRHTRAAKASRCDSETSGSCVRRSVLLSPGAASAAARWNDARCANRSEDEAWNEAPLLSAPRHASMMTSIGAEAQTRVVFAKIRPDTRRPSYFQLLPVGYGFGNTPRSTDRGCRASSDARSRRAPRPRPPRCRFARAPQRALGRIRC